MFRKKQTPQVVPEWMIVGLGNPGPEYRGTRHNVGFEVIDEIAAKHRIQVSTRRHQALYGTGEVDGYRVALVKPMTYMNLSGQAVAQIAKSFGVVPKHIIVVADDLDMEVGKVRRRMKGSSGGHNGHKSIIASLRTEDYPRVKIGIGKSGPTIDHVLSRFNPEEREKIMAAIDRTIGLIIDLMRHPPRDSTADSDTD